MHKKGIPINKGNYSMDTAERDLDLSKIYQLVGNKNIMNIEKNG